MANIVSSFEKWGRRRCRFRPSWHYFTYIYILPMGSSVRRNTNWVPGPILTCNTELFRKKINKKNFKAKIGEFCKTFCFAFREPSQITFAFYKNLHLHKIGNQNKKQHGFLSFLWFFPMGNFLSWNKENYSWNITSFSLKQTDKQIALLK